MKSLSYSQIVQDHLLRGMPSPITGEFLTVAIHSEDPSGDGQQSAYEIPGVPRGLIARAPGSWQQDGARYRNAVAVKLGRAEAAAGRRVASFWSISDSDGNVFISGEIKPAQEITEGVMLEFPAGSLVSEEF